MKSRIILPLQRMVLCKVFSKKNQSQKASSIYSKAFALLLILFCFGASASFAQQAESKKTSPPADSSAVKRKQPVGSVVMLTIPGIKDSAFALRIRGDVKPGKNEKGKELRNADDKKNHLHDEAAKDSVVNVKPQKVN